VNTLSPLLLKIVLISLPLSLIGLGGNRLLRHSPLPRQRNFINLIMAALLLLPLLVRIGPSLLRVPLPPAEAGAPMLVNFSQNLVVGAEPRAAGLTLESLLGWTWLLGSLIGFLQLGWGIGRIQIHIHSARPLSDREIASLRDHGRDLPLRRIRLSSGHKGPAAAGFIRPWVLIPQPLFQCMDPGEFRAVVLHEWAHIRNRDGLFSLLGESVMLLYWWNPLLRMMQRQRQRLQEMIGDETAAQGAGKLDYAKALLSLAEKGRRNRELHGAMAFFGPMSLRERIERILNKEERMNRKKMRMGVVVIGSLAMALMLVASGTRFVVEAPDTEEAMNDGTLQEGSIQVAPSASIPSKRPKRIKEVAPVYPPEAIAAKVQGTVIIEVTTNPQGQVRALRVISGHPLFNKAAIDAVKQWTFEPTLVHGQSQATVFPVTVPFTLPQQSSEATGKQP